MCGIGDCWLAGPGCVSDSDSRNETMNEKMLMKPAHEAWNGIEVNRCIVAVHFRFLDSEVILFFG